MGHRQPNAWTGRALWLTTALLLPACAPSPKAQPAENTGEAKSAVFTNGDFETGTNNQPPPSWTVTTYLDPGVTIQSPQTRAGLNLTSGGIAKTYTLVTNAGPESQVDATLGATASFRWPKFGNAVAIVNQLGQNKNANAMKQSMTIASADVDSIDGLAHVRFVLAPVLQDPGHSADQQPYFYVQLTNVSKGNAILYQDYNFANQPGVPWKNNGAGVTYTDWALVDIAPGSANLAVGDQVELEIIASGCSLGGHWGQVYVDGVGATVPGPFVSATGPAAANDDTDITYTVTYKNGGAGAAGGVVVEFNTPPNTTFTSFSAPGLTCTAPPAGSGGLVTCTVGALPPGASGSFQVTVHINPGTTGTVTEGNYDIKGTNISPLLGPKVYTNVTHGVTYADLSITKSDGVSTVAAGGSTTYTIVASNAGPNDVTGATVTDNLPAGLTGATWTCVGTGGATCAASGTGSIHDTVSIPAGQKVTYTLTATVPVTASAGTLANIANVSVPAGASDPAPTNNAVGDYDAVTAANGTDCTADADCTSGVCDPSDHKCGYATGDGPCSAANGGTVCRSGLCSPHGTLCIPAGGCGVDADCAGTQWCNTQSFSCTPKLPNGTPIPSVGGHTPALEGLCTGDAASAVCTSGVCDQADNLCGLANSHGPCTVADAATVCRSGACSVDGTCEPAGGCNADGDCAAGFWCNISAHACAPQIANGGVLPSDPGHTSPVLNAKCTDPAAAITCVSGVCDATDDRCGYANGDGACTAANADKVCRSAACDPDGKCGYANGDGPCIPGNTQVCRSGACSANGAICVPAGGCAVDADCGAGEWCDSQVFTCRPKLPNGTVIPTVPGHSPPLTGTCSAPAGAAVCASGVCDTSDNLCGYANGDGPCTAATGAVVCRSGSCGANGTCQAPVACTADADCDTATQFCDTGAHVCTPKLPNGVAVPTVSGHTPALDGKCSPAEATVACRSGVCETSDDKCGFANGDGPCTAATAGTVCRSSTCSANAGVCIPSGGCAVDADCTAAEWCNTQTFTCTPKLPNGGGMPTVSGHTPALDGKCSTGAGTAVCASGVCDTADDKCGYANGDGPCTLANGVNVCRSGLCSSGGVCIAPAACTTDAQCDAATQYCNTAAGTCAPKLPNGASLPVVPGHAPALDGSCSDTSAKIVCLSGTCDAADGKCGHDIGKGPCDATNGAVVCRSGECATTGANQGLCVECLTDAQCAGAQPVCDTTKNACVQCTTAEDAACAGATPVCVAGADTCAPCDGDLGSDADHACAKAGAPFCFLSGAEAGQCGKCTTNADCQGHEAGPVCDTETGACGTACFVDADCDAASWCNAGATGGGMCVPKLDNGTALPSDPPVVAKCSDAVGKRVCKSGVCDPADDKCGLANGDGACTGGSVCRSGACDATDQKCGFANGDGPCTSDAVCRVGTCDATKQICRTGCTLDSECPDGDFCRADGACTPKLDNGEKCTAANQCASGACDEGVCDRLVASGNGLLCAASPAPGSGEGAGMALVGLMLATAGLARRRRR